MINDILLLIIPISAALLIPALSVLGKGFGRFIALAAFAATSALGIILLPGIAGTTRSVILAGWAPPFGISLLFTPFSLTIAAGIALISFFIVLADLRDGKDRKDTFYMLLLLMSAAASAMVLTTDLFNLFVFMEIAGITAFALTGSGKNSASAAGSFKYLVAANGASLLMLVGVVLLYTITGHLSIAGLIGGNGTSMINPAASLLILALILLPLLLESKILPMNFWIGGVYRGAPVPAAASVSGIVGLASLAVLIRFLSFSLDTDSVLGMWKYKLPPLLLSLGAITVLVAEGAALVEKDLKKVLGFSSAGQAGMILVGVALVTDGALTGALILLLAHGAAKLLLFVTGGYYIRTSGSSLWRDHKGLGRKSPLTAGLFAVGALSLMGMPLFPGFWGKLAIIKVGFQGFSWTAIPTAVILLGTVLEGITFLRIAHNLFTENNEAAETESPTLFTLLPALILAAALLFFGVFPRYLAGWSMQMSEELLLPQYLNILTGGRL